MKYSIEVDDKSLRRALDIVAARVRDMRPAFNEIGDHLRTSTILRIRAQGPAPDGRAWAPMSPITAALRRRKGKGAQLLQDTGRLANSITKTASANAVVVGTNTIYARMLQFGAKKGAFGIARGEYTSKKGRKFSRSFPVPWGTVPGRPFLGISTADRADIIQILRERLFEALPGQKT